MPSTLLGSQNKVSELSLQSYLSNSANLFVMMVCDKRFKGIAEKLARAQTLKETFETISTITLSLILKLGDLEV